MKLLPSLQFREREGGGGSFTHMFTDDTKVSNTVPDNTDVIQKDLDSLQAWSVMAAEV